MKSPYRARGAYFYGRRFDFSANLHWVRWNEFGFKLEWLHNANHLKAFVSRYSQHDSLWLRIGWFSGHLSLSHRSDGSRPRKLGWVLMTFGDMPAIRKDYTKNG